ncbi:MAG: hypothetical protein Q4F54_04775 [Coriobacteriia bacterium]|nr:hypothetical protein [Coriobacteriia bacterium]
MGVFISPYLDTFNTTLTDLDLSNFNIINSYTDYGAICANCKALTKVTLPSAFIDTKDEDTNNNGSNIAVGQHGEICSFAGAFYGCESLQEITNLSKFNPFTVVNRAG